MGQFFLSLESISFYLFILILIGVLVYYKFNELKNDVENIKKEKI
jgi:hypothetical protein